MNAVANKKPAVSAVAAAPLARVLLAPISNTKTTTTSVNSNSKQSRVVALLQSPTGATIAKMMKVTGWQQHSVRGFLAGAVRKRLKLKLTSVKVDGNRVYQITGAASAVKPRRSSKARSR
jgi:hypothetical protein